MANLTKGAPPQAYGNDGRKVILPMKALAQVWQGAMVAQIAGACCTGTTALSGHCIGVAEHDMLGGATDGATRLTVWTDKTFIFNAGTFAPTDATPFGTVLFLETDNTVGTGAGNETQIAGRFVGFEDDGRVRVFISPKASWFDANANLDDGGSGRFKCRAVVTTLQAYTGSTTGVLTETANGAISAADGVTLAVGDVVFIQEGTANLTAASDAGPYVVTNLGSAGTKWVLTRPSWWQTGAVIVLGTVIEVGGEGTGIWSGSSWKTFAANTAVVDTTAPSFWAREISQQITFVGGNNGTAVVNNVGIRSATKSNVQIDVISVSGTNTGITGFGSLAITPGVAGTGTFTLTALGTALASIAVATTSVVNVTITNW